MRMNWLGKLLIANAAYNIFGKIIGDRSRGDYSNEEPDFSNTEVEAMMRAVERKDYEGFKRIYLDRRPRSEERRIIESYEWFDERRKNGWK